MIAAYAADCPEAELASTGLLPSTMMPTAPTASSRSFLLYNPGTERAHTTIRLAGDVGEGLLIRNLTTGQRCKIVNLSPSSLLPGAALALDSEKGQTRIELGDDSSLAFPFHDEGYIELAPCTPFVRAVRITHTAGSNVITSDGAFQPHMKGQYLYLDGWVKLRVITDGNTAIISRNATATGAATTPVVTMNEIELSGDAIVLSRFDVSYTPLTR